MDFRSGGKARRDSEEYFSPDRQLASATFHVAKNMAVLQLAEQAGGGTHDTSPSIAARGKRASLRGMGEDTSRRQQRDNSGYVARRWSCGLDVGPALLFLSTYADDSTRLTGLCNNGYRISDKRCSGLRRPDSMGRLA